MTQSYILTNNALPQVATQARPTAKKSQAVYWVFGAIATAAVLLFGVAVLIGAAAFIYTQQKKQIVSKPVEKPIVQKDPVTITPVKSEAPGNETVKAVFKVKNKVGKFELTRIYEKRAEAFFQNADGEAGAIYTKKSTKSDVFIEMATYSSKEKATGDFGDMITAEKKAGVKMLMDKYEDGKTVNAVFKKDKLFVLTFCSFRTENMTPCYRISSADRTDLVEFHDSFFGK